MLPSDLFPGPPPRLRLGQRTNSANPHSSSHSLLPVASLRGTHVFLALGLSLRLRGECCDLPAVRPGLVMNLISGEFKTSSRKH